MTARDRIVLLVVLAVAAVAGSWMLLVKPKQTQAANLGSQVQALQSKLDTARGQISAGLAARAQFASDYTQLASLGEALPEDDNVPSLIYEIQSAASATRVDFRTLNMAGASSSSSTPTTSTSSSSSSAAAAPVAPTLPPGAALGPAGFPVEQFNFSFTGSFFHLSDFFARLQRFVVANNKNIWVSGRLITLNALSLGPGPQGFPEMTATVSATTYMAPAGGVTAGATPAGPSGTTTTPPAASGGTSASAPATITPPVR